MGGVGGLRFVIFFRDPLRGINLSFSNDRPSLVFCNCGTNVEPPKNSDPEGTQVISIDVERSTDLFLRASTKRDQTEQQEHLLSTL